MSSHSKLFLFRTSLIVPYPFAKMSGKPIRINGFMTPASTIASAIILPSPPIILCSSTVTKHSTFSASLLTHSVSKGFIDTTLITLV